MELKQSVLMGTLLCFTFLNFSLFVHNEDINHFLSPQIVLNQSVGGNDSRRYLVRNRNIQLQFRNRVKRVEQACKEHKNRIKESQNRDLLLKVYSLEPSEKIAICRTAKHGSTTWAKNFMHVYLNKKEFVKGPKVYQRELAKLENGNYTLEEKEAVVSSFTNRDHLYLTFFVCRNPIERQDGK